MAPGQVEVQAFTRSKAIPATDTCHEFPILVRVTAAPWRRAEAMPRAGVDVVAVLDNISRSMQGEKLKRTKQAMKMVIDKLGPNDRLSIVSFEANVHRLTELTYMSDQGRHAAGLKVDELESQGVAEIASPLREGALILRGRGAEESSSRVGCMMLLSGSECPEILEQEISDEFPAYTFCLGADHDPKVMKYIADKTSGTYCFVNQDIKDAVALFIAGLTSVTATSVKITLRAHEGVAISSIESGGYGHHASPDKRSGEIDIANMYAGERKNFIVYVTVAEGKTKLVTVGGQYQSLHASEQLASTDVSVLRPGRECSTAELAIQREVAAELVRIRLEKGVSAMLELEQQSTGDGLQELWDGIKDSDEGRGASEATLSGLRKDVAEMKEGIESLDKHRKSGLSYMLSWLSSHKRQRATTSNSGAFQTLRQRHVSGQPADGEDDDMGRPALSIPCSRLLSCLAVAVLLLALLFPSVLGGGGGMPDPIAGPTCLPKMEIGYPNWAKLELDPINGPKMELDLPGYPSWAKMELDFPGYSRWASKDTKSWAKMELELSRHPSCPKMEQDLKLMLGEMADVQITSFFKYDSVSDMEYKMDRYLYLAVVHASTVLWTDHDVSAIRPDNEVRRAAAYLQDMLKRMKDVEIPSFEDASVELEHTYYRMTRYLYSTIVQATVLRSLLGGGGLVRKMELDLSRHRSRAPMMTLDVSEHPRWPKMEQDLELIFQRSEDVQFTSFFQNASTEDIQRHVERYLYLAIVHAAVLHHRNGVFLEEKWIPEKEVRDMAVKYLADLFNGMDYVEIPSFQDASAEFMNYEMNRYLYSTIVQATVLQSRLIENSRCFCVKRRMLKEICFENPFKG